jgi:hypothetical protein
MFDENAEAVSQPVGVALGEIDLPLDTVQTEADRLRRGRAIDVVLKSGQNPGRHNASFFPSALDEDITAGIPTNRLNDIPAVPTRVLPLDASSTSFILATNKK